MATGNAAPFPYTYEYARPGLCIKPRFLTVAGIGESGQSNDDRVPHEEGVNVVNGALAQVIWTTVSPANLVYTYQVVDPTLWEPTFASTMSIQLAAEIALPVTGNGADRGRHGQGRGTRHGGAGDGRGQPGRVAPAARFGRSSREGVAMGWWLSRFPGSNPEAPVLTRFPGFVPPVLPVDICTVPSGFAQVIGGQAAASPLLAFADPTVGTFIRATAIPGAVIGAGLAFNTSRAGS